MRRFTRAPMEALNARDGYVLLSSPRDDLRLERNTLCTLRSHREGKAKGLELSSVQDSHILRSFWLAACGRIVEAADALQSWLDDPSSPHTGCMYYIHSNGVLGVSLAKAGALSKPFSESKLATIEAQSKVRFDTDAIAVSAALTLARQRRRSGDLDGALAALGACIDISPLYRRYLENAEHALNLELAGRHVPGALRMLLGDADDYLATHTCAEPFKNFYITHDGGVTLCCGVYLPTHIGNIVDHAASDVLNSEIAQDIRKSILDGSFRYCDFVKCPAIYDETLPSKSEEGSFAGKGDEAGVVSRPKDIQFGLDLTCNLRCPQCRPHQITVTGAEQTRQYESAVDDLVGLLGDAEELVINPSGEVFASKPSRRLLHLLAEGKYPDLKLNLITNGVLFSEQEWTKFEALNPMLNWVRVSIDAASKAVYDKIRVGGDFDKLCENLKFIQSLRDRGIIKQFEMLFVYQLDNYTEIPAFVRWAKSLSCDRVIFQQLHHYGHAGYSAADVAERAVFARNHALYGEFIKSVQAIPKDCRNIVHFDVQYDV